MTALAFSLSRSLDSNELCGIRLYDGEVRGTYTVEGIIAITEMLKVNATLQSIRCASPARFLTQALAAADVLLAADGVDCRFD